MYNVHVSKTIDNKPQLSTPTYTIILYIHVYKHSLRHVPVHVLCTSTHSDMYMCTSTHSDMYVGVQALSPTCTCVQALTSTCTCVQAHTRQLCVQHCSANCTVHVHCPLSSLLLFVHNSKVESIVLTWTV